MKRFALIAVAVLLPFSALVVWGLGALREPAAAPPPMPPVIAEPSPAPAPAPAAPADPAPLVHAPLAPVEPVAAVAETPAPPAGPVPGATANDELAVRKKIFADLDPAIHQCFEQSGHLQRPVPSRLGRGNPGLQRWAVVATEFFVNPDGSLGGVHAHNPGNDEALNTCVKDALAKARVDPHPGSAQLVVRHAFGYKSRPKGD